MWAKRDETENTEQQHDEKMLKEEVMPMVEKMLGKQIDEMLNMELENMRTLTGKKSKKKKGKGKKKGGKKKKGKKDKRMKFPGFKAISKMSEYECLIELVRNSIVKRLPPANLKDFLGEFNYIASMTNNPKESARAPSMAIIRQLVTEYIIFPLGS